ncbi:MAG: hypothetical protein ACFB2X_17700 [Rivularia sp. (in: cyanobacteria)]
MSETFVLEINLVHVGDRSYRNSLLFWEYPNFAKIKFVVGASRSLLPASEQDAHTTKKNKFTHLGCSLYFNHKLCWVTVRIELKIINQIDSSHREPNLQTSNN